MKPKPQRKIRILSPAPWWRRFLAYLIDCAFLFIILVAFIYQLYGNELVQLLNSIENVGALSLLNETQFLDTNTFQYFQTLTVYEQNLTYFMLIVRQQYSDSIFILSQTLSITYFLLFWWRTGQTIGAMFFKIRVISPSGFRINLLSTLSRIAGLKLIESAWGIPVLFITNPLLKQRIHDSLSNTFVVIDQDPNEETANDSEEEKPKNEEEEENRLIPPASEEIDQ